MIPSRVIGNQSWLNTQRYNYNYFLILAKKMVINRNKVTNRTCRELVAPHILCMSVSYKTSSSAPKRQNKKFLISLAQKMKFFQKKLFVKVVEN